MGKLRTAAAFSAHEWWILIQAWVMLVPADVALRALPFKRVRAIFGRQAGSPSAGPRPAPVPVAAERLVHLVDVAARHHIWPTRCLPRALVGWWLLGREGIAAELRFGVRRRDRDLEAHAWLECDGQPLGPPHERQDFAEMVSMAGRAGAGR